MCVRCGTGRVAWCTHPTRHGDDMGYDELTFSQAMGLSTLLEAVVRTARFRYYPEGADTMGEPVKGVLRAITHDGGGLWFDSDGDIRDAFVWTSGVFEHWYPVKLLVAALSNMTTTTDASAPMLVIDN